ncbi:MAG: DUF4173 domain-containing protein [Lewinellaceae bacterium]|nr:DUF4173 domain-containing protein [Lewinellaceae bacterium]
MMRKSLFNFVLILFGSALYVNLFWQEQLGLNALLFSLFAIAAAWWRWPEALRREEVQVLIGGTVLSALLTVWHNSLLAKTAHVLSFLLLIGYLQQEKVRFVVFALLLGLANVLETPLTLARSLKDTLPRRSNWQTASRWAQLALLPLGLGTVFAFLYYHANPRFALAFDFLWRRLSFSFEWILLGERLWPLLRGIFVMAGLLGASHLALLASGIERKLPFSLNRRQKRFYLWPPGMLSLRNEYQASLIAFGLLNGLLFLANIADLRYVWISYGSATPQELSQYVHEGTYLLIFAILLAMAAVIWYFRGNLNFYPENAWLRGLAFLWLAQNAMLALSVGLRNWHYVAHYGLAYKRLGVFWFLSLVLYGLYTLFRKVKEQKSLSFLLHCNGWAAYVALILFSFVNWDLAITRYNLKANMPGEIDARFLFEEVSDKNLYLLYQCRDRLLEKSPLDEKGLEHALREKRQGFTNRRQFLSWRSWNYADIRNEYFLAKAKPSRK